MPQRLAQLTLVVRDYDEAIRFYTQQLGFELLEDTPLSATKRWVRVAPPGAGPAACGLLLAKAATAAQRRCIGQQAGGRVWLFLYTDDFWRDYHQFMARGVVFEGAPRVEAYGTVAVLQDLYGNRWDLLEPTPSGPVAPPLG